jgi:hypothetical protein
MRVRPTHYTIVASHLKSWVVEGSVDGESWTEIDRHTHKQYFEHYSPYIPTASNQALSSFAVSKPGEWRFIRLADKHSGKYDKLYLVAVEFFDTLSE